MSADPDGITISVTVSNPGIPSERRDAVSTSYRHGRRNRSFTGIGLGPFVSRQIVELHGGSMRLEDPEHRGTRVVITLPATAATPVTPAAPPTSTPTDPGDSIRARRCHADIPNTHRMRVRQAH